MAINWLADVRKYDPNPNRGIVAAIVRYCGLALRTPDGAMVTFADPEETAHVRESFLKQRLGLTDSDEKLNAGIAEVSARMEQDEDKNRVTAYYLLTKYFDKFDAFGHTTMAAAAAAAAAAASQAGRVSNVFRDQFASDQDEDPIGNAYMAGLALLCLVFFSGVFINWLIDRNAGSAAAPEPAAVEAMAEDTMPDAADAVEIPEGAGVIAAMAEEKPMLTVYFDTGAAEISPEFEAKAADLVAYLEANPDASVAISGFNDPSGDAELNAELSKNRAESVQAALVAQGVDESRTDLVEPDDTTITELTADEARRVEVTIVE